MDVIEKIVGWEAALALPTNTNWRLAGPAATVARSVTILNDALVGVLSEVRSRGGIRAPLWGEVKVLLAKALESTLAKLPEGVSASHPPVDETVGLFWALNREPNSYWFLTGETPAVLPEVVMDKLTEGESLNGRLLRLRETVAFPSSEQWAFLADEQTNGQAEAELNAALAEILVAIRRNEQSPIVAIVKDVKQAMECIDRKYPECRVMDSEGLAAAALFFAVNWHPVLYCPIRYLECPAA